MAKKHNSINDSTAQSLRNIENTLEILTKLDQSLNSNESFITVKSVDSSGREVETQLPTVGYFKQQLDQIYKIVKVLSGVDGNPATLKLANNAFKRIIAADLNVEPKPISSINNVSTFKADPNWIFDAFLNPKISIELDLTNKIAETTRLIESKRFIVEFEKIVSTDDDGNEIIELTPDAQIRLQEFNNKYKGQTDIDMVEFVTWLDSPGLLNRLDDTLLDQETFRIEPNRLQFKGDFTITNTELDNINKKLWYVLDSLTYYDISDPLVAPKPIDLKVGDMIKVNPNTPNGTSATVYKVVEISTITSQFRVRFEQVFGEEPIPVRLNAISYYSEKVPQRKVKISIGFDEYNVVFIRAIDEISNVIGRDWSPGVGFYTNELRLENENGETFNDFYVRKVYDYGMVLQDLVEKKIPNYYGSKPLAPVLDVSNFKVVQVNEHLTQTQDAERIRDLHNQKNNITSQITQIQNSIEKQNRILATTTFDSAADRKRAEDDLVQLNEKLNSKNSGKVTVIQEILANKKNINKILPEYKLRGFWPMVQAVINNQTRPQEVVQYEIRYRRLSKSGDENPILTITDLDNSAAQKSSNLSVNVNTNIAKPKIVNATFSNWTVFKTDARKRVQDPITSEWLWEIEDVSDANTPNINQLDIPIYPGERIEFQVRSLSEVGWPETPITSEWSETIFIDFPDNLNSVLNEDDFILQEASADEVKVQFERDLEARGLNLHLSTAIRDVDIYYAHTANSIASGFKDNTGRMINLYDYLLQLTSKTQALEEQLNRAKGILDVFIVRNSNATKIFNGNNITFNLNLEDYMTPTKIGTVSNPIDSPRTYKNELLIIEEFSVLIKNSAESANLGLLSYRGYGSPSGMQSSTFAYNSNTNNEVNSRYLQAPWLSSDSTLYAFDIDSNSSISNTLAPRLASQRNNQWIWQQVLDLNGQAMYYMTDGADGQPSDALYNSNIPVNNNNVNLGLHSAVTELNKNIGLLSGTGAITQNQPTLTGNVITDFTDNKIWSINEDPESGATIYGSMGTTIHPTINQYTDLLDTSSQLTKFIKPGDTEAFIIPIYIYAKPFTGTGVWKYTAPTVVGSNNTFLDTGYLQSGGDMPVTSGNTGIISGKLTIQLAPNGSNDIITDNDKLVITGFTHPDLVNANNKPIRVLGYVGANEVRLDYNVPAGHSSTDTYQIIQLHKRYQENELWAYNVLGRIGGDERYVTNYIEIKSSPTTPTPKVHSKKVRFLLEDENSPRPFDFQLTWNITQFKPVTLGFTLNPNIGIFNPIGGL